MSNTADVTGQPIAVWSQSISLVGKFSWNQTAISYVNSSIKLNLNQTANVNLKPRKRFVFWYVMLFQSSDLFIGNLFRVRLPYLLIIRRTAILNWDWCQSMHSLNQLTSQFLVWLKHWQFFFFFFGNLWVVRLFGRGKRWSLQPYLVILNWRGHTLWGTRASSVMTLRRLSI
jgi:hypothetical protein